jgi:hypothetical protein
VTHIGFTGTRNPLTAPQLESLQRVLQRLQTRGASSIHHGDCRGADEAAHRLAGALGLRRVIHPPDVDTLRAFCLGEETCPPAPYLTRNRHIVEAGGILVACPDGPERLKSGTWSTVRHARKLKRPCLVIWPDGTVTTDRP